MDYYKLNSIINNFIKRENVYIDNLELVIPLCKSVLEKEELSITNNNYSTSFNIDESINLISKFLSTIDINLEEQFINIVKGVDSNNEAITIFNDKMPGDKSYSDRNKIYIGIDNTLDDTFLILHEVLHYMNSYQIIGVDDNNNNKEFDLGENYTRSFYGEAVSITAEKLFGEYLVQNNYINKNDFNIRQNKRLKSTREDAESVIIENLYIEMLNNNIKIDTSSIKEYSYKYKDDSIISKVISKEINTNKNTYDILGHNSLQFPTRQRYVIAEEVANTFHYTNKDIERFKYLNHEVGNINANLYETTKNIQTH